LNWFELAFGLTINFLKSKIGGVGVNHNLIQCFMAILNCDVAKTPIKYLGMLVGGATKEINSRRVWWKE